MSGPRDRMQRRLWIAMETIYWELERQASLAKTSSNPARLSASSAVLSPEVVAALIYSESGGWIEEDEDELNTHPEITEK